MEYQNNSNSNKESTVDGKSDIYSSIGKSYNDLSMDEKDKLISILKDELDSESINKSTSKIS